MSPLKYILGAAIEVDAFSNNRQTCECEEVFEFVNVFYFIMQHLITLLNFSIIENCINLNWKIK